MILWELAQILRSPFEVKPPVGSPAELEWFNAALLSSLPAGPGTTADAVNRAAIVHHCAEVAKSVDADGQIALAELISTMLGYFIMRTIPWDTRGLLYSGELHPISNLARDNGSVVALDAESLESANRDCFGNSLSSAIIILRSRKTELEFRDHVLPRLLAKVAAIGIDVLVSAECPQRAANIANAICMRQDYRTIDFPLLQSRLGLAGISLRCV